MPFNLPPKKHTALRILRVKALWDEARRRQQSKKKMNVAQESMMYLILWLVGLLSPASSGKAVLEYNIADEVHKTLADPGK